jgi:diguanylate cyclase (GGDEF)-like protein
VNIKRSTLLVPVVALALTIGAIAGVWLAVQRGSSSRDAQVQVSSLALAVAELGIAPFNADPATGGSATASLAKINAAETAIAGALTVRSQIGVPPKLLARGRSDLAALEPVVRSIYRIATHEGLSAGGARVPKLNGILVARSGALSGALATIGRTDSARAAGARTQIKLGVALAMLLLLIAFVYFYVRSVAAREAVNRLALEKGHEARTDALTGLGNRRALENDFDRAIAELPVSGELLFAMFDLDGFKQYNDTFGHAAGDSLLQRLGGQLAIATQNSGCAYRMGGDEFCVLVGCPADAAERLLDDTAAALQDRGDGWEVRCSQGAVWIPSEAANEGAALKLADERMYAHKAGRSSASRQLSDVLLQVLTEQNSCLDDHVERVSEHCGAVAETLGLQPGEVSRTRLAAKLHDVGKTAIPAAILNKPSPLNEQEWEFMRRHPLIGERIALAAPALASSAALIRSSHERIDGAGYPDGLVGDEIPLGSRIIAVCDAFDAMTSERPYRGAVGIDAALKELQRCAGTQFDANVVEVFCRSRRAAPTLSPKPGTTTSST